MFMYMLGKLHYYVFVKRQQIICNSISISISLSLSLSIYIYIYIYIYAWIIRFFKSNFAYKTVLDFWDHAAFGILKQYYLANDNCYNKRLPVLSLT